MKKSIQITFVLFAALMVSGCGRLDFSENSLIPNLPISLISKAGGIEVVSGSAIGQKTVVNGYTVSATVGTVQDRLVSKTPNGYTVYHGVQGAIASGQ